MKNMCSAIAASFLGLSAAATQAEEFPKSGKTTSVGYLMGSIVTELDDWESNWRPGIYVVKGNIRNETISGPFDNTFIHCVGQQAMVAGNFKSAGYCTQVDNDGDKIFLVTTPDTFSLSGGTGKYEGITGGGTYHGKPVIQRGKDWTVSVTYETHWEIKAEGRPL